MRHNKIFGIIFGILLSLTSLVGCKDKDKDNNVINHNETYYSVIFNGTKCKMDYESSYVAGSEFHSTIIPFDGYLLPQFITQQGLKDFSYDSITGNVSGKVISNVIITCSCFFIEAPTVNVTFTGKNCFASGYGTYEIGSNAEITIIPNENYSLPETITVTGTDTYNYDKETGIVSFLVLRETNISVSCEHVSCTISTDLSHCSLENLSSPYNYEEIVDLILVPENNYMLPPNITLDNAILISYDAKTGAISFKVMGNVFIKAECIYIPHNYSVSLNLEHCFIEAEETYLEETAIELRIIPEDKYVLPEIISVSGLSTFNYNKESGVITGIVVDDVTIGVTCTLDPIYIYTVSFNGIYCSANNESKYNDGETVSFTVTPISGYKLPSTIDVTGNDSYTYDPITGVIEFVITGDVSISLTAIEIIYEVSFTFIGTNCSCNALEKYEKNEIISFTITPIEDYELSYSFLTEGLQEIDYNATTGQFRAKIVDNASLTVSATPITKACFFNFYGTHCSMDCNYFYNYKSSLSLTIVPDSGYELPNTITVTGCNNYSYDKETGIVTFTIKDDVTISCDANVFRKTVTFLHKGKYVSMEHQSVYKVGDRFNTKLVVNEHFSYPDYILTKGLDDLEYDNKTGNISAIVADDIEIQAVGVYDSSYFIPLSFTTFNCEITGLPELCVKGETITFTIIPNPDCTIEYYDDLDEHLSIDKSTNIGTLKVPDSYYPYAVIRADFVSKSLASNITHGELICCSTTKVNNFFTGYIVPEAGYGVPDSLNIVGLINAKYDSMSGFVYGQINGNIIISGDSVKGKIGNEHCKITEEEYKNAISKDILNNVTIFAYVNYGEEIGDIYDIESTLSKRTATNEDDIYIYNDFYDKYVFTFDKDASEGSDVIRYTNTPNGVKRYKTSFSMLDTSWFNYFFTIRLYENFTYNEIKGCYEQIFDGWTSRYYFKDGKFATYYEFYNDNNFVSCYYNFSNIGSTEVDVNIPDEFYTVTHYYGMDGETYGKGYFYSYNVGGGLSNPLYLETTGLLNPNYSYVNGKITGVINGNVVLSIDSRDKYFY